MRSEAQDLLWVRGGALAGHWRGMTCNIKADMTLYCH
jgi:hypothetical protein